MQVVRFPRCHLRAVSRFSAVKDIRFYLNGVFVDATASRTVLVGTDGHVLGAMHSTQAGQGTLSVTIPSDVVARFTKYPSSQAQHELVLTESNGEFTLRDEVGGVEVKFKGEDGRFPDWARIVPASASNQPVVFNPNLMVKFADAAKDLQISKPSEIPPVWYQQNGESGTLVRLADSDFLGVVMPVRHNKVGDTSAPGWFKNYQQSPLR